MKRQILLSIAFSVFLQLTLSPLPLLTRSSLKAVRIV